MTRDDPFYTVTMAEVHVRQGNRDEAARIYRHLLEKEPGRPDLIEALAALEDRSGSARMEDLLPLFRQWLDLIFRYNKMNKLKKLERLNEGK